MLSSREYFDTICHQIPLNNYFTDYKHTVYSWTLLEKIGARRVGALSRAFPRIFRKIRASPCNFSRRMCGPDALVQLYPRKNQSKSERHRGTSGEPWIRTRAQKSVVHRGRLFDFAFPATMRQQIFVITSRTQRSGLRWVDGSIKGRTLAPSDRSVVLI